MIIAETGGDMARFTSARHLASWALGSAQATTSPPTAPTGLRQVSVPPSQRRRAVCEASP
ncbi:hypothetical protein ABT300_15080 [Streptomyces sp. NPDC001027]|uniref:hypothetical protein n=1 Tax=Streptomyces sp. NPDC001027 TaxID=3154771 RepID=UPI00332555D4